MLEPIPGLMSGPKMLAQSLLSLPGQLTVDTQNPLPTRSPNEAFPLRLLGPEHLKAERQARHVAGGGVPCSSQSSEPTVSNTPHKLLRVAVAIVLPLGEKMSINSAHITPTCY